VADEKPLIRLRGVDKTYGGVVPTKVLHKIDLDIFPGDFAVILGKSGSGKTTLLNLIGLLDAVTAGTVEIEGREISTFDADERAQLRREFLGFIFQFHYLLPDFNVLDNVLMPCRIRGRKFEDEARGRAMEMLEKVGLSDKLESRPAQLSGGQKQRVAVVRAFANNPTIVLADEPTGSLDSKTTEQVLELMHEIQRDTGAAFVMVTHDEAMTNVANRIIELQDGRVIRDERTGNNSSPVT
jgi:lipoprotein-releasing system ATP-binding protein